MKVSALVNDSCSCEILACLTFESYFKCDVTKSHKWAANLASEHRVVSAGLTATTLLLSSPVYCLSPLLFTIVTQARLGGSLKPLKQAAGWFPSSVCECWQRLQSCSTALWLHLHPCGFSQSLTCSKEYFRLGQCWTCSDQLASEIPQYLFSKWLNGKIHCKILLTCTRLRAIFNSAIQDNTCHVSPTHYAITSESNMTQQMELLYVQKRRWCFWTFVEISFRAGKLDGLEGIPR